MLGQKVLARTAGRARLLGGLAAALLLTSCEPSVGFQPKARDEDRTTAAPGADGGLNMASAREYDGYVVTPVGRYHGSCVRELRRGERVDPKTRTITRADGSNYTHAACAFPAFRAHGNNRTSSASESSLLNPPFTGGCFTLV